MSKYYVCLLQPLTLIVSMEWSFEVILISAGCECQWNSDFFIFISYFMEIKTTTKKKDSFITIILLWTARNIASKSEKFWHSNENLRKKHDQANHDIVSTMICCPYPIWIYSIMMWVYCIKINIQILSASIISGWWSEWVAWNSNNSRKSC